MFEKTVSKKRQTIEQEGFLSTIDDPISFH